MTNITPVLSQDKRFSILSQLIEESFNEIDLSVLLVYIIDKTPLTTLPFLAEQFSLTGDGWELAESETQKRDLLKRAIELHRYKGTPWAVREIIRLYGFGEVEIIENLFDWCLDGSAKLDGTHFLGDEQEWARYLIVFNEPITNDQAISLRKAILSYAPKRSYLERIDFMEAAFRLDGSIQLDGQYNLGTIDYA